MLFFYLFLQSISHQFVPRSLPHVRPVSHFGQDVSAYSCSLLLWPFPSLSLKSLTKERHDTAAESIWALLLSVVCTKPISEAQRRERLRAPMKMFSHHQSLHGNNSLNIQPNPTRCTTRRRGSSISSRTCCFLLNHTMLRPVRRSL